MAGVLITGGAGLIGRHTVAAWPASLEAHVVRREDHDLEQPGVFTELIEDLAPEVVLHLAWCASSTPDYRSSPANRRWRTVSAEAARTCLARGTRFIGTGTVVDDQPGSDAYTTAKSALRGELDTAIGAGAVTWLRPHHVFDPDVPSPAVLRAAAAALREDRVVELTTPWATHDFVHAADVGRAVVAAVVHGLTGVVDVGSGTPRTVSELVECSGARWSPAAGAPPASPPHRGADLAALGATGWFPSATEGFFARG